MTGKTNANFGSGKELELLWTNPNPSSPIAGITISASNYKGFVVDVTQYTTSPGTTYLRNFVQTGTTQQLCGGNLVNIVWYIISSRAATATIDGIQITPSSDGVNDRCIPLRVYGIK